MNRHPENKNLTLCYPPTFFGRPLLGCYSPYISEYLHGLVTIISSSLDQYSRVFAFRVDLRMPEGVILPRCFYTNFVIERFFESFKAKIKHNRMLALRNNPKAHDSRVRYIWAREIGKQGKPHYHLAILLNRDAFRVLGSFDSESENIFNRLCSAWASALDIPIEDARGLVHIPKNPGYYLDRGHSEGQSAFFERASYLCKAETKCYGDGQHGFGCSRG